MKIQKLFVSCWAAILSVLPGLASGRYRSSAVYLVAVLLSGWCFLLSYNQMSLSVSRIDQAKVALADFQTKAGYTERPDDIIAGFNYDENPKIKLINAQVDTFAKTLHFGNLWYRLFGWVGLTILLGGLFLWAARVYMPEEYTEYVVSLLAAIALTIGGLVCVLWVLPYVYDGVEVVASFLWSVAVSTWRLAIWLSTSQEYLNVKVAVAFAAIAAAVAYDLLRRSRRPQQTTPVE